MLLDTGNNVIDKMNGLKAKASEELCVWLGEQLEMKGEDGMLEIACKVIAEQGINGKNFLACTQKDWERWGVPLGIAKTLVQITERVKEESGEMQNSSVKRLMNIPNPHFVSFKIPKASLSIGSWPSNSDFVDFYHSSFPYIDKTGLFPELIGFSQVFLSRPRKFGKSLLLSTLKELFLGNKNLFKGLAIEDIWNWKTKKYPVIKLDFGDVDNHHFEESLIRQMISIGQEYGIHLRKTVSFCQAFRELYESLSSLNRSEGRRRSCVILVDEYDKPVIDVLEDTDLMEKNLRFLKSFLLMVKAKAPYFSLVTGKYRIPRFGVFGGDVREDISFSSEFNALCGFTADEIQDNLGSIMGRIKMENLTDWYNGYCFGGSEAIYNPFSIANCIVEQELRPFWVQNETPTLLARYCGSPAMKEFVSEWIRYDGIDIYDHHLFQVQEVDEFGKNSDSLSLLFQQSGYISIIPSSIGRSFYKLGIPNKEIKNYALPILTIGGLLGCKISDLDSHPHYASLHSALKDRNIEAMYDALFSLFQAIGCPDREKIEDYYQKLLQPLFLSFCPLVRIEQTTFNFFAEFPSWTILLELKVVDVEQDIDASHSKMKDTIDVAFGQIDEKYLTGLVPDVVAVMAFNSETRTLYSRESLGNTIFYRYMKQ